jgi:6-phosphogluconolactonase
MDLGSGGSETGGTGGDNATGGQDGSGGSEGEDLTTFVYVGSGDWAQPNGGLVTVYEMDRETQTLSYVSEHSAGGLPSFLAIDRERLRLFAADESTGGVLSFSIDASTGQLTHRGTTVSENHPVYVSFTEDGSYLLAANYNEGSADVYPIDDDGVAQTATQSIATGTQAHCIVIDSNDRVLVANKGQDTISHFEFSGGQLSPAVPASTQLASPRHIFHGPDGNVYVVSEEADLITAFDLGSDGGLAERWQQPRLPTGANPVSDTGADIHVSPSGQFLYATNRGNSNTVVAYDIQGDTPSLIGHESSQGTTPRNLAIDPLEEFLIVANHGTTTTLATFKIAADGSLTSSEVLPVTSPPYFVGIVMF